MTNIQRIQIVCFLLLLYSSAFCLTVSKKNVQIIKRKYIMTNIDTQETDYSVYTMWCPSLLLLFNMDSDSDQN
jgi:hypothetical protein